MDLLLTLILSCSVHFDDSLVEALAYKLSLGNQFFVADLTTTKTYDGAKSVDEALRFVDAIKAAGGRPAVGYMAIPVDWATRFSRETNDLFDGCTNIGIGTAMLSDFARLCSAGPAHHRPGSSPPRRRARPTVPTRMCILRRLEAEMNTHGILDYVMPTIARLEAAPPDRYTDPPTARAPLLPDNTDNYQDAHDWSSPRLFVSSPTALLPASAAASRPLVPGPALSPAEPR